MSSYYNENNAYAAQWLRNLIAAGHLPDGVVDDRSIEDVCEDELREFDQCHFFAGIGGWPYALRLAGVPDDAPVWTGSCPCQPFSVAGKQRGTEDERHLWPVWKRLIEQCRPAIVFGEQVASLSALAWLDAVFDDLESAGYACAAANLCAASVGAPHIRQRLYWTSIMADTYCCGQRPELESNGRQDDAKQTRVGSIACNLADTISDRPQGRILRRQGAQRQMEHGQAGCNGTVGNPWAKPEWIECRDGKARPIKSGIEPLAYGVPARILCTCTQCHTETMIYEGMYFLRKIPERENRLEQKEILRQRVLSFVSSVNGYIRQEFYAQQSTEVQERQMRTMREHVETARPSHRQESDEQHGGQFTNSMFYMSSQGTCKEQALNVRRMWKAIQGCQPQELSKQNLFCPVCERVGAHLCKTEVVKNIAGKLRAYGNAIVPQVAAEFVNAALHACERLLL